MPAASTDDIPNPNHLPTRNNSHLRHIFHIHHFSILSSLRTVCLLFLLRQQDHTTMPPAPSQKGTGKKNANAIGKRSRNTTPMSVGPSSANIPPVEIIETEYLDLKLELVRNINYDDLVDSSASNALIPDSKSLDGLITRLGKLNEIIERRGTWCDKGMRLVAGHRKAHFDEMATLSRRDDARKDGEEETERRANKKKRKANDSLAPGDAHTGKPCPSNLFMRLHYNCVYGLIVVKHCCETAEVEYTFL